MPIVDDAGQDVLVLDIRTICPALISAIDQGQVIPEKLTGACDWEIRLPVAEERACGCPAGQKHFLLKTVPTGMFKFYFTL